jgi:hypothetical protein
MKKACSRAIISSSSSLSSYFKTFKSVQKVNEWFEHYNEKKQEK